MRDSFVLHTEIAEHIEQLTMEQRGILFTGILNYVKGDEPPRMDSTVAMAFSFIRYRLDLEHEKYNATVEARRRAGAASGEARRNKTEQTGTKRTHVESVQQNEQKEDKEAKYSSGFLEFWDAYPRKADKGATYKKYQARLKDGYKPEELLMAAKNYRADCSLRHTEEKYIKHGKTFLGDSMPFTEYLEHGDEKKPSGGYDLQPGVNPYREVSE